MLKELKDPSVDDAFIDKGCDEVISLLTSSLAMIESLLKHDATLDDVEPAKEKIDEYVKIYRECTITGDRLTVKLHVLNDHGAQCLRNHIVAGLPLHLAIEQFVERNHQEGKKLDQQVKRIVSAETMANKMAKVKALDSMAAIRARIQYVDAFAARGEYKKKSSVNTPSTSTPGDGGGEVGDGTATAAAAAVTPIDQSSTSMTAPAPAPEKVTVHLPGGGKRQFRDLPHFQKGAASKKPKP